MRYRCLLVLLFSFFATREGASQEIDLGLVAGMCFAQIDGDNLAGYNNLGPYGGLKGTVALKDEWGLETQINYILKGTRTRADHFGFYNVNLHYLEFPVLINYSWDGIWEDLWEELGIVLSGGVSPNYLIHGIEDRGFGKTNITNDLIRVDLTGTLGVGFRMTEKTMIRIRFNNSLLSVRKSPHEYWFNRSLSFTVESFF